MAVRNNGGCRRFHSRQDSIPELPAAPSSSEPAMRRWPIPQLRPRSRKQPGQSCIPSAVRFPSRPSC